MELDQTKGETMYPDVTAKLLNEAVEALTKLVDTSSTKLTKLDKLSLKVLQQEARKYRQMYELSESHSDPLERARMLNRQVTHYEHDTNRLRQQRNAAIHEALESGLSAYRVAKELGITEQAIYKVRDAK